MNHYDVAIIGAGIIGTALADAMTRRGRTVALVDDGAAGTTSTSYAWINSHNKHPHDYHQLNLAGVQAWHAIAAQHPEAASIRGHLEVACDDAHRASLEQRVARLHRLGYRAEWADAATGRTLAPVPINDDALVSCAGSSL